MLNSSLDNCPSARHISLGVGYLGSSAEVTTIGKAVLKVTGQDILDVVGIDQLCAGQPGGCEAAVHDVYF